MTTLIEPIKVLHLVDSLQPGGMENGIVNVATGLDEEEFDIHVCCLTRLGEFAAKMPRPEQVISLNKEAGFTVSGVSALRKQILDIEPDLLHTHNLGPLIYGVLATGFGRTVPILHGEHGQLDKHHLTRKRLWQRHLLYRGCIQIHTVSESLRSDLIAWGFSSKRITSVTNGVDTERFRPPDNKELTRRALGFHLPDDGVLLGIVGRFSEFKGHDLLLEAFEQLCEEGENLHLLLIGAGGPEEEVVLDKINNSPYGDRIHAVGHQAKPECFYQSMDLMVFPSSHEGLSNAILESMACGVPVLASNACGNDEAIVNGENSFLESIGSSKGLANSISRVLATPSALAIVGKRARQHMVRDFSIGSMVDGYQKLYRDLART